MLENPCHLENETSNSYYNNDLLIIAFKDDFPEKVKSR